MGFSVCSVNFFDPLWSHWPYEKHFVLPQPLDNMHVLKSLETITVTGLQNVLEAQGKGRTFLQLFIFFFNSTHSLLEKNV